MTKPNYKRTLSPRVLAGLVAGSPEGFFPFARLDDPRLAEGDRNEAVEAALAQGVIGRSDGYVFDPARLDEAQVRERSALFPGSMPPLRADGTAANRPIAERRRIREQKLNELGDPDFRRLINAFEGTLGYLPADTLCTEPGDEGALIMLQQMSMLKRLDGLVFDPLRISRESVEAHLERQIVAPVHAQIIAQLDSLPGKTAPRADLVERFGSKLLQKALDLGGLVAYGVKVPLGEVVWVRLEAADPAQALETASAASQPKDEDWQALLDHVGPTLRHDFTGPDAGAPEGETPTETIRDRALARSYALAGAAKRLGVREATLQSAIANGQVSALVDPEGVTRIGAGEVQAILDSPNWLQYIENLEVVRTRELKMALGEVRGRDVMRRLRHKIDHGHGHGPLRWGQVRAALPEPITLAQFREWVRQGRAEYNAQQAEKAEEERRRREEERRRRDEERRQRDELRARLLAAFPAWAHPGRADQRVLVHIGPTNSGKTHHALDALSEAGTGWYLAPLRLLAYEVFDRLNRRGVRCNLLTGEEFIPVEGATVTAATIEMFNPDRSGACVVIDEAQMLADPERGWAWTRALMEAQAPEIRLIGPLFARSLIERVTSAVARPIQIVEHERLAPLELSPKPWPLATMPPRTILVAFSRRMVLRLKTELENYGRTVSVIYGNLPPEVRRRQSDRFADGQTEICVATDAVGMGLNLPADNVCFFELEKFDGKEVRALTAAEVSQIGGRAGRFGLSQVGQVGAVTRRGLQELRALYNSEPEELRKARVAPALVDLEMIPGSLARRLARWRELQSIPESLRDVIEPADIDERIALASMLTDAEVEQLGLAAAIQLTNAPTRESSRPYWYQCARAILAERAMPIPPEAPLDISSDQDLEATETAITCADIYLWLACRGEFSAYAAEEAWVRSLRAEWSLAVDGALLRRLDTAARCISCHRRLPASHRYTLCDACYVSSRGGRAMWWR
ncbi:MAG: hypothetical protein IT323_00990 [Anaerolineae bacterium]|nr:hypothetical protein [Anaerolineae bacterium]